MKTILVIDDDVSLCNIVNAILTEQGYAVVQAHRGQMGLEMAIAYQPDLILCDVMLPDLLGWDVLSQIRSNVSICGIPFIFLSSLSNYQDMRRGMKLGADDYLLKPIEADELIETLEACLRKNELLTQPYLDEMKRINENLQNVLYQDTLTGLANQVGLRQNLSQNLLQTDKELVSVMVLRLEEIQESSGNLHGSTGGNASSNTNGQFGQDWADHLVVHVGQRLEQWSQGQSYPVTIGRLDRSLFALVLNHNLNHDTLAVVIQDILDRIQQPYTFSGQSFNLAFKVGAYLCKYDCPINAEVWLDYARIALQWCDRTGDQNYHIYNEIIGHQTLEWCRLQMDLSHALQNAQLEMHYQPIANMITGRLVGVEALLRWNHPQLGQISPSRFIPIAEESDLILELDFWGMRQAFTAARRWQSSQLLPLKISVNLSSKHLQQEDFPQRLKTLWEETGCDPHLIMLEITEQDTLDNFERAYALLSEVKQYGVQVVLDDFGQGSSSLNYLRFLPLDIIKVNRALIQSLEQDDQVKGMLKGLLRLAQTLNIKMVAAGVETKAQLDFLHSQGYQMIQGHIYHKPMGHHHFEQFLQDSRALPNVA